MKLRQFGMIIGLLGLTAPVFAQIHNIVHPGSASGNMALQKHLQQKPLSQQLLQNMANRPLLMEPVLRSYDHSNWEKRSGPKVPVTYFRPGEGTILPRQLAEAENATPQARANAVKYYEGLIELYQQVAQQDGFPANSVAYAFNYYVVNNYHVMYDMLNTRVRVSSIRPIGGQPINKKTVTLEQERNLFKQFETMLGEDPSIQQMTDAEKQSITESLAIMTNECFKLYQYALDNNDKEVLQQAKDTALHNLVQLLGERAMRMRITDRGMEF
ncbi:MAG: DUF6683 family protein [Saprospiraceae bacterium]|nr:hypothetical protein [Lewinella sp.]